ncbi:MAG: helix-turn-helix domain-containing protein [Clostridiales bacterium]|nr:helix-turn-helix domain-containing protein [Clostridiales bacterium]
MEIDITNKHEVLQKHVKLINELEKLNNYSNLLTFQEMEAIHNKRDVLKEELECIKAIESTWPQDANFLNHDNIIMYTRKEIASILKVSEAQIKNFVNIGMLKPIKTGKSDMFLIDDIYDFEHTYRGMDISNYEKALICYHKVKNKKTA